MISSLLRYFVGSAALGVVTVACSRVTPLTSHAAPAPFDSALSVASFDSAWTRIKNTYYDTTFRGHDWGAVRTTFRPIAVRARSIADTRQAIESLFVRLGDSHFALIPGDIASAISPRSPDTDTTSPGTIGMQTRLIGERLLVSYVAPNSPASSAGIRAGWEVTDVDDLPVGRTLAARRALQNPRARRRAGFQIPLRVDAATHGPSGSKVRLAFRRPDGRSLHRELIRSEYAGEVVHYGFLPPQYFEFEHARYADDHGCVGVIRFNVWMVPLLPHLERAMDDLSSCRGVVVDLRGNVGGVAALIMGASGFFVEQEVSLGTLSPRGNRLRYVVNPRRSNRRGDRTTPFSGSVAVLVDGLSASTSEIFAAGMRDIGRARVFGDTTAGEALPAAMARLPNGDLLIHAVADFHSPSGARVESTGVVPDVVVPLTRRDLIAGRDPALAASMAWAGDVSAVGGVRVTQRPLQP